MRSRFSLGSHGSQPLAMSAVLKADVCQCPSAEGVASEARPVSCAAHAVARPSKSTVAKPDV